MKKYYPILLSKAGEIVALSHLSNIVKEETSPIIQVLNGNLDNVENFIIQHWNFESNDILLDFSLYEELEEDLNSILLFFERIFNENINAIPVVQQNSPNDYLDLVKNLVDTYSCKVCIRTSNDSGGFINYNNQIDILISTLQINSSNSLLLLDLGYVKNNNYNTLATVAILTIQNLIGHNNEWSDIIVASGSFPESLNGLVPNNVYHLDRYEWYIWLLITSTPELMTIVKYGDYGTKNPIYADVSFLGTSSIKYTTKDHYVIYRGELPQNHARGMGQYIDEASILILTSDYSGSQFSWGDSRIQEIVDANNRPGNPKTWVEISQNHHLTLMNSLL